MDIEKKTKGVLKMEFEQILPRFFIVGGVYICEWCVAPDLL
jgi:hypothetical protein